MIKSSNGIAVTIFSHANFSSRAPFPAPSAPLPCRDCVSCRGSGLLRCFTFSKTKHAVDDGNFLLHLDLRQRVRHAPADVLRVARLALKNHAETDDRRVTLACAPAAPPPPESQTRPARARCGRAPRRAAIPPAPRAASRPHIPHCSATRRWRISRRATRIFFGWILRSIAGIIFWAVRGFHLPSSS